MRDIKEILIDIKYALLEIKEELSRANDLKEVELDIKSPATYKSEVYCNKIRKMEK